MKILALTKYGTQAASTRQRLMQFEPFLRERGFTIDARPLLDDDYVRALAQQQRASRTRIATSYLDRLVSLLKARHYDLIWVHFEAFPWLPSMFERLLALSGTPVIVDFDDAIFHMYDRHPSAFVRALLGKKLAPLLRNAAGVTVGNEYLGRYIAKYNSAVTVIPTVVDTQRYVPPDRRTAGPLVVGWIGSPSTWRYMEAILPDILPTIEKAGAIFRAVGAGPAARAIAGVDSVDWTEASEICEVQNMDIGIMPLPDEDWAKGKCGYKLIQYMACGLPTVASPVGVNSTIVEHGRTGLLAMHAPEWQAALELLLGDPGLRLQLGEAGRNRVVENYSLSSQQLPIFSAFQRATSQP